MALIGYGIRSEKDYHDFMRAAERNYYMWNSGDYPTDLLPYDKVWKEDFILVLDNFLQTMSICTGKQAKHLDDFIMYRGVDDGLR